MCHLMPRSHKADSVPPQWTGTGSCVDELHSGKKKIVAASKELLKDGAGRTSFLFVVTFSFRGDLGSEIRCGVNDVLQSDCRLGSSKCSSV